MKKILITGGAVHAHLDDIKIITNNFKGGLMVDLAGKFVKKAEQGEKIHVFYLCSKNSQQPWWSEYLNGEDTPHLTCIHHDGIDDYMKKVLEISPSMDAVILGAAIANLIPKNKIEGKFPSHNYKEGDTIPIDFTIAPRIIDRVKEVAPHTLLFGYKLLSGVSHQELIRAAYGVLLESKAVTVFANDAENLMQKYAITKDRGVHSISNEEVFQWISDRMEEKYYSTKINISDSISNEEVSARDRLKAKILSRSKLFIKTDEGYVFGSGAIRIKKGFNSFVTTSRGKNEIEDFAFVEDVDHDKRKIFCATTKKASLNAPLFHYLFSRFSSLDQILHFHCQKQNLETFPYSTPGTDSDSVRESVFSPSFNIEGHGCILGYDRMGRLLNRRM